MPRRRRPEDDLQRACVELLTLYRNQGKLRFFAVPNGGLRSKTEASIMKGLGVMAGVPDLLILGKNGRVGFTELKAPKGRASDAQLDWEAWLKKHGYAHAYVRNLDQMQTFICWMVA